MVTNTRTHVGRCAVDDCLQLLDTGCESVTLSLRLSQHLLTFEEVVDREAEPLTVAGDILVERAQALVLLKCRVALIAKGREFVLAHQFAG